MKHVLYLYNLPFIPLPFTLHPNCTVNPIFEEESSSSKPLPRHWIHDSDLMEGSVETIREEETVFWNELIKTYLYPLEGDKKQQEKTQEELLELRYLIFHFVLYLRHERKKISPIK